MKRDMKNQKSLSRGRSPEKIIKLSVIVESLFLLVLHELLHIM